MPTCCACGRRLRLAACERIFEERGNPFEQFRAVAGATLRVDGIVDGEWKEMLRFDDFIEKPHYHAPASDHQVDFDRDARTALVQRAYLASVCFNKHEGYAEEEEARMVFVEPPWPGPAPTRPGTCRRWPT